ncbi:MAG TPA: hypothetical protein VIY90_06025 [Steroidobacteraceae bacterium]
MSVFGPRAQSRSTALLFVAAAHGLFLWSIWRVQVPVAKEIESFTSVMFFLPKAVLRRTGVARAVGALRARPPFRVPQRQTTESATAVTLPATPSARIDWSAQLAGIAQTELDKEAKADKQLRALTRRFAVEPDPRYPRLAPASTFHWYEAGTHRIDTRGQLPVLQLNDHCVLLMFIVPICRIGHVEIHGDLFDGAAKAHGDRLATPGPNEVP